MLIFAYPCIRVRSVCSVKVCMLVNMDRRRNEIAVEWLESKNKGQINRINVTTWGTSDVERKAQKS